MWRGQVLSVGVISACMSPRISVRFYTVICADQQREKEAGLVRIFSGIA